ncbi:uncharacterized protein BDZ83DRAFT_259862 [Colletotrichum acutatum]|uniref:Uncharacterized protein n=1 Tax=Glomerella acutata TaxID=27357 RepID=A0AAD8UUF8_GLOAC|nr:uncharacterized protein BDZ83DRAFT_259862 [Colletotrichum acutatum]KAK1726490.1 hypothetical protein BDZ83DRAFT_259862 [Colletotrichum acutatum]
MNGPVRFGAHVAASVIHGHRTRTQSPGGRNRVACPRGPEIQKVAQGPMSEISTLVERGLERDVRGLGKEVVASFRAV